MIYLCGVKPVLTKKQILSPSKFERKMKKLMLFFVVAAAVSFAACSNANKQEAAPEAAPAVVETPAEVVDTTAVVSDSIAVEAPVAEEAK
jgi:hypothetical protein